MAGAVHSRSANTCLSVEVLLEQAAVGPFGSAREQLFHGGAQLDSESDCCVGQSSGNLRVILLDFCEF